MKRDGRELRMEFDTATALKLLAISVPFALVLLFVAAMLILGRAMGTSQNRMLWLKTHFPLTDYSICEAEPAEFVKAWLENQDATMWQYLDIQNDAHEIIGGVETLCSMDCLVSGNIERGMLFFISRQRDKKGMLKIIMTDKPYDAKALLFRVRKRESMRKWIQSQYRQYEMKSVRVRKINPLVDKLAASLWMYIPTWKKGMEFKRESYKYVTFDDITFENQAEYDNLYVVDNRFECIYLPVLEFAERGTKKTFPFDY